MQMHASESGFHFELLGDAFTPDEMGRIKKMEVARQQLTQNGTEVLVSSIQTLRDAKNKEAMKSSDLTEHLAFLRAKKAKLHKGKADTQ